MAGKYWWRDEETETVEQDSSKTTSQPENKYWWRDEKTTSTGASGQNQDSGAGKYWWRADSANTVGENLTNRVNTWLENHNNYITNYQTRNSGRKYNYEDSYVSDSASWLETVSKQKSNFDAEADSILAQLDQYKGYFNDEWVESVRKTLTDARSAQDIILANSTKDNEWWSSFGNEELVNAFGSAENAYKYYQRSDGYRQKYAGQKYDDIQKALSTLEDGEEKDWLTNNQYEFYKDDTTYNSKSRSGWKSFEAQKIAEWKEEESKTWFDKALESFATTPADTSLPNAGLINAQVAYTNDTTYREPNEKWSADQRNQFGYLWATDRDKAYEYAVQVNSQIADYEEYLAQQGAQQDATKNGWTMTGHTIGAIASAPLALGDLLGDLVEYSARGTITSDGMLSPFEYSQAVQSGIANKLNKVDENGVAQSVLPDWVPIVGGKGWGDVYSLGVSAANSLVSAYTLGGFGTLVNFIGQGGASGVDEALSRGASPGQALLYGAIVGAAEGVTEMINADNLLKIGSSATLKNYLLKALNQGIGETVEEGASSVIGNIADAIIMQDKSNFNASIKEYMDSGMSKEEAKKKAWIDMVEGVAFDALGGFVSGFASGSIQGGVSTAIDASKGNQENIDAVKKYGGNTDALIQEGLQSDKNSESYQLADKYRQQVQGKNGKAMTGFQIRNLLAANQAEVTKADLEKIQNAAANRLAQVGQREDIYKIAELATKYATGQEMTRAERSALARSNYGSQVASEMLNGIHPDKLLSKWENNMPEESGAEYSTDWTGEIGTESDKFLRYNNEKLVRTILEKMANMQDPAAYKSLESRMEAEEPAQVSDTGKSVIRGTEQEVDLAKPTIKEITEDGAVLEANGESVNANDIDYADENLGYAVKAVGKIENITPEAAGAVVSLVDMTKPVVAQMNALDEAFTYGFHNYSEADLKAGLFTKNLTEQQLNDAYKLGQYVRGKSDVDADAPRTKMRTEADAKMTAEQKTAKQKARIESDDVEVYYISKKDGKSTKFTGKYDPKRMAAVNTAKFLSKLKIGGKYYFYESYVNAKGERVYKDANGVEKKAPNGMYMDADGSIWIDLNAGDAGEGTALFTLGHELTHFVKDQSKKQFKILADLVKEAFDKTDMSMHKRVLAKQKFLENARNGEAVSYDEAYEEVVADAMSTMLTDGSLHEKLMEIKVKDKGLFNTIKRFFEKMIAKFREVYAELTPDQQDARDIRAVKEMFDKIQTAFAEALVEASDNFQAAMESVVEAKSEPMSADDIVTEGAVVTDGEGVRHSIRSMKHDITEGKMFEDLKNVCGWTQAQVNTLKTQLEGLVEYMIPYRNILDMNETYGMEGRRFSPYKPNSDPLYKISMDFSTLCSKRLLTQYVIEQLQLRENRPMSAEEQMAIRAMLNEYRKVEKGLQVACAMCYVEAARLKSPKQMQRWLDDPAPLLKDYFGKKNKAFNDSVKKAQADFKESKGYDREAPKKDMKPADVKELNKIGPKMRSQYHLSAEEQAIVDRAKSLPNSTYLTAGNLANLSETDPVIYDAYTAFVRTATRSKSLETDEPYYYGDSMRDNGNGIVVTDSFIESVNKENGMRFSSWSDWRIQHLLDYITAVIDNSVRGAAMHGYTKFGDEVRVLGKTGMMFNMSGVAGTQTGLNEDGNLNFSDTESIDVNEAIQLREEFPETAGLQCIGVGDDHITALLRSDIIDYVIPYHVSGLNAALRRMADIHGWKDYTATQHAAIDKSIKLENAVDKEHWHEEPVFSEFFVGYDTGMTGIEAMKASAEKYKQMCKDRGLTPKFNQFATEDNYWKLLIDRKMINQQTGQLIRQKAVTPTFDFDVIKGVVDKFVDNYDAGLEARALNHVVENWDSIPQRIKDLKKQGGTKAKQTKKAVNTLANQTVAAQPKDGEKRSDRITLSMTDEERTAILNKKSVIAGVYDGQAEGAIKRNQADLDSGKIGLVKSALVRIGDEFGIFADYDIADIDVKIQLSKSNIKESVSKDISPVQIAKLLPVLRTAVENSIGIESHANRYFYDDSTVFFENLLGGYVEGEYFVPVRFGLKHSTTGEATLYVIVDQQPVESKKIKAEVVKTPGTQSVSPAISRSAFKISVANLARFVNGKDLLRYLPDNMLSTEQKKTKWEAIAETVKKTNSKNDVKYTGFLAAGNLRAAQNMVNQAAKVAGYTPTARYHQTASRFTQFSTDHPVAGLNDSETPNGIFFKDNDHDIGLGGAIQMKMYLKADNMLHFADRKEANAWYCKNVPGYDALQKELEKALKPFLDQIDSITEQEWDESKSDEEIDELFEEEDRVIKAMGKVEDSYRAELRKLLDRYFLNGDSGYDGIELDYDGHRWVNGKREDVHTFIVFHPSQAKSADPITYDDNGNVIPISERFNMENNDIRYSERNNTEGMSAEAKKIISDLEIRARFSRFSKGEYASYSAERIERELHASSSDTQMDYAKSYIAWVKPEDFLYATTTSEAGRAQIEKEAGELDLERLRKQTQPIHLTVDFETGKIVGHEGRHRMIALQKAGVNKVAVIFDAWNDDRYNTKPVDMMRIGGQEFDRYHGGLDFYVHDMLPLSKRYADAAKKLFSEVDGSIKFSERGEGASNRHLLANAFEGLSRSSAEYKMIQDYKEQIKVLNLLDEQMSDLNAEIREIRFTKGKYDAEKLRKIEEKAERIASDIDKQDKVLIRMEASEPLRKVIARERKKEAQKTKDHVKEIQQNKKVRAEQTELRYKIQNFKKKLEAKLLRPTDRQYVPVDLIGAMVEVCNLIDTDTNLYKADGSINNAQVKRDETKEKLQNLKDEYEKLKNNSDPIYAGEFDEMVYAYLTELRDNFSGKSLKEMTTDELAEMYEILHAIDETLADARKLIGWGDAENVYEAGDSIVAEQDAIAKKRKNGKRNAVQKGWDTIDNLGLSPVRNVERMSGYNQDSALLKLFKKFEQGVRKKNKFKMDAYKLFEQLTSGKEYDDAIYNEVGGKKYTDVKGRQFGISKMQMMQSILSWERETANKSLHHIEQGGFTFADLDMLRKGNLKDAVSAENSHRVPAAVEMVAEFQEILKGDKWCQDYMAVARSFFNGMAKDAINETSISLKHRIIAKDKNYIPFEVDKNFVNTEITDMDAVQQTINSYGMLKDTKNHAPQALYITGLNNILDRHIEQVGTVYGLAIEVRNFNKVWNVRSQDESGNDPTVKESIDTNWGKEGVKHIEQAVKDIQGSRVRERNPLYDKAKSGYIGATFLLNLSVVTKQVGSLFSSTSMLRWRDPAKMIGNLIYTMANSEKIAAEVDKYTATAWMRRQGMSDAELYTLMTQAKKPGLLKAMSKLPAVFNPTKWITAMDHAVALSLWKYAKQDTAKRTGLDGEALLKATAAFYDEVVENTQSMTDVLHRPEIQKRGDVLSESFAMFKTDLYQMAGQLQATAGRFMANKSEENGKALGRTVYAIAMGAIWGSLMTTVFALLRYKVNRYRDDEDDELTIESWLKRQGFALVGDLAGYIFPIFGSEVVGVFENIMYGESDDVVDSIALTAINDLYSTMMTIGTSIKDGEMPDAAKMRQLSAKALQVFGIPANNILRALDAIKLHAEDIANGEFLSFNAGADSKTDDIYEAIMAGDQAYLSRLKSTYKDDSAYQSAVRKALRENDPRIHDAAQAKYEGRTEEYKRIFREIQKEGKFSFDDIMSAVNSEESAIRNKLEPDKATSSYTASDFVESIVLGDSKSAEAMKEDIIATKVANGKTQAEAEKEFISSVATGIRDAYSSGLLDEAGAEKMLMEYADKDEEEAASKVGYWGFCEDNPKYDYFSESNVKDYREFAEPENISLEAYAQFINGTKGLADIKDKWGDVEVTKREQVLEVIDSLPLTWAQKDALYLAAGYSESKIWDVPW